MLISIPSIVTLIAIFYNGEALMLLFIPLIVIGCYLGTLLRAIWVKNRKMFFK